MAKKPTIDHEVAKSQTRATWIASVVAAVALLVSLLSLYESHETRMAAMRDELLLRARRPMGDQQINIKKVSVSGGMRLGAIAVPWEVLLSNTGNSTASITGYEVTEASPLRGQVMYSGIDGGVFSPEGSQAVALPITLEAGKSIRLIIVIGLNPGPSVYAALSEDMTGTQKTLPLVAVEKFLAKRGIDIYDNPITPMILSNGEVSGWSVEKQGKEQVFLIKVRTARGIEVSEVTSWYDLKRF
jgi:hypothetical protein